MEIRQNHIKIGNYIIQYNFADEYGDNEGFVVIDKDGQQVGDAYEHLNDAMEQVLKYNS